MKRILSILMTLVFSMSMVTGCFAAENANFTLTMQIDNPVMTVNGTEQNIDNEGTSPVIVNDRTLVPIRAIIEAIGGTLLAEIAGSGDWQEGIRFCSGASGDDVKTWIESLK